MDEREDEARRRVAARAPMRIAVRVVCYIARRLVEPCASSFASTHGPDMVNSSVGAPLGRPTAARLGLPFPMPPKFIVS